MSKELCIGVIEKNEGRWQTDPGWELSVYDRIEQIEPPADVLILVRDAKHLAWFEGDCIVMYTYRRIDFTAEWHSWTLYV